MRTIPDQKKTLASKKTGGFYYKNSQYINVEDKLA
jgi:hypothetical protein